MSRIGAAVNSVLPSKEPEAAERALADKGVLGGVRPSHNQPRRPKGHTPEVGTPPPVMPVRQLY